MPFSRRRRAAPRITKPADMTVGSDGWKTFVADAVGVEPSKRSKAMRDAIDQAARGDDDLPEALRDHAARLANAEMRISWDGDEPDCAMTPMDYRLFLAWDAKASITCAHELNRVVEDAVRDGADLVEATADLRKRFEKSGATREDVEAVLRHVGEVFEATRPSPAPGAR